MKAPGERTSFHHFLLLIAGHVVFQTVLRLLCRLRVIGSGRLPAGGAVLVANHRSFADPPLVGAVVDSPLRYFARSSLWNYPFIGSVLRMLKGIPVDRGAPSMQTMRAAVSALREGGNVLVFPEGTRTKTGRLQKLREGPALFARRGKKPIIPIYLGSSEHVWPRGSALPKFGGKVTIVIGPALGLPPCHASLQDKVLTRVIERWMRRQERRLLGAEPGG